MFDGDDHDRERVGEEPNSDDGRRPSLSRRSLLAAVGGGGLAGGVGLGSASGDEGDYEDSDAGDADRDWCPDDAEGDADGLVDAESIEAVATFPERLLTGVAVSGDGRTFVNFPRFPWATPVDVSVAEVTDDGSIEPYPSEAYNEGQWNSDEKEWLGDDPATEFVAVQSVHVEPEAEGTLWVLDTGNPEFEAIVEDGPKLVEIDVDRDEVADVHYFSPEVTPETDAVAYLNDVRVDVDRDIAYLTESELGALVVADLETGEDRRLLDDWNDHPSTHHRPNGHYDVGPHEGQSRPMPGPTDFHADGIAIAPDEGTIYYHALSGRDLYRIDAAVLRDFSRSESEMADQVERVGTTDVTDGMLTDEDGNVYHTDLEDDAITRWNADTGEMETVVQDDDRIAWPDSMAWGPDGDLYVTTSKLHLEMTDTREEPFELLGVPDVGP